MDNRCMRILLVEDDEDDYVMTRDLLAEIGDGRFDLAWVETYEAALEAMARRQHEVYLLDYRLGARTGLDLLREAREKGCKTPMILLTGQGDHEVDVAAMRAGAADYLVKGQIDAPQLGRAIRYTLERAQTLEALREAHQQTAQLLAAIPSILIGIDANATITWWNAAAERTLGMAPAEVIGQPLPACRITWEGATILAGLAHCRNTGEAFRVADIRFQYPDGKEGFLGFTITPMPGISGDERGFLLIGTDITKRKILRARN
jgi:PAS domain S-box-containing protein